MRGTRLSTPEGLWPFTPNLSTAQGYTEDLSPTIPGFGRGALWPSPSRLDVGLPTRLLSESIAGPLSGGGNGAPWGRSSDGSALGTPGGRGRDGGPGFNQPVKPGGYLWWYVDGISDCGQHGLTIIIFVGSVFSPYYHWSHQRALGQGSESNPEDFCSVNVALYSPGKKRWTMTERGARSLTRTESHYQLGPSRAHWDGQALVISIDEWNLYPIPRRVKGQVRLEPEQLFSFQTALDSEGRHRWGPIAPRARIHASFEDPNLRWSGHGYLDSNEGDEPIEGPFSSWDWCRADLADGSVAVLYDIRPERGADRLLALRFRPDGSITSFEPVARTSLGSTAWRVPRSIRAHPHRTRTLEDTPFYARGMVEADLLGERVLAMHETLNLPRLRSPVVKAMLPWRMPRLR